jgi:hypothetical protein
MGVEGGSGMGAGCKGEGAAGNTVNPALLASSFVWQIQPYLLHISLFKVILKNHFSQGKYKFMKFLFVLLDNITFLTL